MKLTSTELNVIQETLKETINECMTQPDCDYDNVKYLVDIIGKVDGIRRKTWHDEKFGVYEEIADEVFSSDDIPF